MLGLPDLSITKINTTLLFETHSKNTDLGNFAGALGLGKTYDFNFLSLAAQ